MNVIETLRWLDKHKAWAKDGYTQSKWNIEKDKKRVKEGKEPRYTDALSMMESYSRDIDLLDDLIKFVQSKTTITILE